MGELQPTGGSITRHPLMKIGYFSQHFVEHLTAPDTTVANRNEIITALSHFMDHLSVKGEIITEVDARTYLAGFGLKGKVTTDIPLTHLSGGQKVGSLIALLFLSYTNLSKVRLALALVVYHQPPLLLLDEV